MTAFVALWKLTLDRNRQHRAWFAVDGAEYCQHLDAEVIAFVAHLYRSHPTWNQSRALWNAAHSLSQSVAIIDTSRDD
jgi:hypothetical protein